MSETDKAQAELRETAQDFVRVNDALKSALALPVVRASPKNSAAVAAMLRRGSTIQTTIEGAGRMIDGARKWFADTFGAKVEDSVPLANPAIGASIQTSTAAMKYFLRDAKAMLDSIIARERQYESMPEEQRKTALASLAADPPADAAAPVIPKKFLVIGALAIGAFVLWKGQYDESEETEA